MGHDQCNDVQYVTQITDTFPQACRVGFPRVAAQQCIGTCAAIHRSPEDSAMRKMSTNECAIVPQSKAGIGWWRSFLAVRLVLTLSPGPGRPFCHTPPLEGNMSAGLFTYCSRCSWRQPSVPIRIVDTIHGAPFVQKYTYVHTYAVTVQSKIFSVNIHGYLKAVMVTWPSHADQSLDCMWWSCDHNCPKASVDVY